MKIQNKQHPGRPISLSSHIQAARDPPPKTPQESQEGPKTPPKQPQTFPKGPWAGPRRPQDGPNTQPRRPRTSPKRPWAVSRPPKTSQDAYKSPQGVSKLRLWIPLSDGFRRVPGYLAGSNGDSGRSSQLGQVLAAGRSKWPKNNPLP